MPFRRHGDRSHMLNSSGFAVWSDEDYIGKVSRLARTVHPLTQSLRVLQKTLGCYQDQVRRLGRMNGW